MATAAGHAAVITALVLVAFWKIEALPVNDNREIRVAVAPVMPPPGGPPPGTRLKVPEREVRKPKPPVPVQPTVAPPDAPKELTSGGPGGGPPGGGGDNPDGDPNSTEVGPGTCATPPCGPDTAKPEPEPRPVVVVPPKQVVVPPSIAAGLRVAGNEKIYPPDSVRVSMMHAGQAGVSSTIKLCVDTSGRIDSLRLLKTTGYADYDAELERQIRQWRYRPYLVNGVAAPMCTVVVVNYRMSR